MQKPRKTAKPKVVVDTEVVKSPIVYYTYDRFLFKKFCKLDFFQKICDGFNVSISEEKGRLVISSKVDIIPCRKACNVIEEIFSWIDRDYEVVEEDVDELISELNPQPYEETKYKHLFRTYTNEEISPRTENQEKIVDSIKNNFITIVSGKAGTGKTKIGLVASYLLLDSNQFDKLVVIRPISTVGASLGFLPGDLEEKSKNYFNPIYSTLSSMISEKELEQKVREKKIVFETTSFLRGETLDCILFIDEVQNMTQHELRTILSRVSKLSKIVMNGDSTQVDLKNIKETNGLDFVQERLKDLDRVGIIKMSEHDIQRHKLVGDIIRALE